METNEEAAAHILRALRLVEDDGHLWKLRRVWVELRMGALPADGPERDTWLERNLAMSRELDALLKEPVDPNKEAAALLLLAMRQVPDCSRAMGLRKAWIDLHTGMVAPESIRPEIWYGRRRRYSVKLDRLLTPEPDTEANDGDE